MDAVLTLSDSRQQRRIAASPLGVWGRAALLFAVFWTLTIAYFVHVETPLTSESDRAHFAGQIQELERKAAALKRSGEEPLTLMFIGNSRAKNVAFDSMRIVQAARRSGFERPVVSSVLAINLGGFERLHEAMAGLERARPDYVVIMPELLYEDLGSLFRARIGFRYLQRTIRGGEFSLFDRQEEFGEPACLGFDRPPEERVRRRRTWVHLDPANPGPREAAAALRRLAENGTRIYVADIPVHPRLAELRADEMDHHVLMARHGLNGHANIRLLVTGASIPADAYCDYAHMSPQRAGIWLRPLFAAIARDRQQERSVIPDDSPARR
jgi:hypothetical protein